MKRSLSLENELLLIDSIRLKKSSDQQKLQEARELFNQRLAAQWTIHYPEHLPISAYRQEIQKAWDQHQLIIIQSETGSGKSTQLPKMALELGYAGYGCIGVTQPRRLATRTLASRLAQELLVRPGEVVGWQVRHQDHSQKNQHIKVMTDGILLQEIHNDRLLQRYTCLIIDEAHERSLNIDIILGYLKLIIEQRPDLKVAIVSATLELDTFKNMFPNSYCLDIPGRSYPIEDSFLDNESLSKIERACWAIKKSLALPGDILMFCPTEAEIAWYTERLVKLYPELEILQLYARLPVAKQQKIFTAGSKKRLILSTNIAETSLTIPNIGVVIDTGEQKIADFNPGLKVMMYPVVPIPQSSIKQRRGRCGRSFPGHCFHLYTEEDFQQRPAHLSPQIHRSSLTQVILKILGLNVGPVEKFPFITAPLMSSLKEALQVLTLLGLIDEHQRLTAQGKRVAGYPLDPRFSLMMIKAVALKCAYPVAIIIGFLSGDDPRVRPVEHRLIADKKHAEFLDRRSDFMTILNLWIVIESKKKELSHRKFHDYCQDAFLNSMHIRSWYENVDQILDIFHIRSEAITMQSLEHDVVLIHRALLAGLFDKVFMRQKDSTYLGPRNIKAKIHPGAACIKDKSLWLMAMNVEQTKDVFLRWVGPIESHILTQYAAHAIVYKHSDPFYAPEQQEVFVSIRGSLWGLPVIDGRRTLLRLTDYQQARTFFIQAWFNEHQEECFRYLPQWHGIYQQARQLAERNRQPSALKQPHELAQIGLELWPQEICNGVTLQQFSRLIPPVSIDFFLKYPLDVTLSDYPDELRIDEEIITCSYCCDQQDEHDGLTLILSERLWRRYHALAWLMVHPYYRKFIFQQLLHKLNKKDRQHLGPLDDVVVFCESEYQWPMAITQFLTTLLKNYYECYIPPHLWNIDTIETYLRPRIIVDDGAQWHDLGRLNSTLTQELMATSEVQQDWITDIYSAYRSGLMKAPKTNDFHILHSYQDYFEWSAALQRAYCTFLLEKIVTNQARRQQFHQLKIHKSLHSDLYQMMALKHTLMPDKILFKSKSDFESSIHVTHHTLTHYYEKLRFIESILAIPMQEKNNTA
ncbi:DUF3418 domain-containing protein, partial [bacterium]|nr:DUF3418 domain-containing protein [bacterium]